MRVALVHDYLAQDGGAERVLQAFHEIWPDAPIFVLFHDAQKINYLPHEKIIESFLSKMPLVHSAFPWYLPLMPIATERHDLSKFDVVISSSSIFAKGIITPPHTLHVSYCHTPPRFLWADSHDYLSDLKRSRLIKMILPTIMHRLRLWDQMSTERVDQFIANSRTVQQRILKYYRRDSVVIHPPVNIKTLTNRSIGRYFAAGGRLVPYKRLDIAIKAFNRLGWNLKIFGVGPELKNLQKISKSNIEFLGKITEIEKTELLARARAFIHPQIEDFGITPVESMAVGRPVIAYGQGGATETVRYNITGIFFPEQTWESLYETLIKFKPFEWDTEKIKEYAQAFNADKFKTIVREQIENYYEEFKKGWNQCRLIKP